MNLDSDFFCSAHTEVTSGIIIAMVAVAFVKQPRNRIGTARPIMILKSDEPGLMSDVLILDRMLVLPIA